MMTRRELARVLEPITNDALESTEADVMKVSVILAAIMGAIDGDDVDHEALDALAIPAGMICEHRAGKHAN
jgi:hypothetical protein